MLGCCQGDIKFRLYAVPAGVQTVGFTPGVNAGSIYRTLTITMVWSGEGDYPANVIAATLVVDLTLDDTGALTTRVMSSDMVDGLDQYYSLQGGGFYDFIYDPPGDGTLGGYTGSRTVSAKLGSNAIFRCSVSAEFSNAVTLPRFQPILNGLDLLQLHNESTNCNHITPSTLFCACNHERYADGYYYPLLSVVPWQTMYGLPNPIATAMAGKNMTHYDGVEDLIIGPWLAAGGYMLARGWSPVGGQDPERCFDLDFITWGGYKFWPFLNPAGLLGGRLDGPCVTVVQEWAQKCRIVTTNKICAVRYTWPDRPARTMPDRAGWDASRAVVAGCQHFSPTHHAVNHPDCPSLFGKDYLDFYYTPPLAANELLAIRFRCAACPPPDA